MKDENAFNRHLGSELVKFRPGVFYQKISDRFNIGISDFLIWSNGRTLALETKFTQKVEPTKKKMLNRPFTGAQITFLENMALAGNTSYGYIAEGESKSGWMVPYQSIKEAGGNWSGEDFLRGTKGTIRIPWLQLTAWIEVKLTLKEG